MSKVEVLPKRRIGRPSKAETLLPDRTIEQREKEIIRHHELSGQHLAQSAVHAALAGLELQAAREQIEHGQFTEWVRTSFPFSEDTGQRYMRLAEGIKSMISKTAHVRFLEDVFNAPPSELSDVKREKLVETLAKATEGQSLRQLYLDFGILKEPKRTGGYNGRRDLTPDERLKLKREASLQTWSKLFKGLVSECKHQSWMDLSRIEQETLHEMLTDITKAIESHLKNTR